MSKEQKETFPRLYTTDQVMPHLEDFHQAPVTRKDRNFPVKFHDDLHSKRDPIMIPHEHKPDDAPEFVLFRRNSKPEA